MHHEWKNCSPSVSARTLSTSSSEKVLKGKSIINSHTYVRDLVDWISINICHNAGKLGKAVYYSLRSAASVETVSYYPTKE